MGEYFLELNDVDMAYGQNKVLDGINLCLEPGTVIGLLGKNGAGKTTLMRIALGLLQEARGEARLFGEGAWNASEATRRRIGYVPQSDAPFSWLRVADCLTLVGSFYENWDESLVRRYMHEWDLDPTAFIQDLSRGQRQKVSILTAIGHKPDLLVLDEPVASLDPGARRLFLKALVELNEELNRTILFSTHITSDVERIVADVAVLHEGKLRFRGDLDELKERYQRLYFTAETGSPLPESIDQSGIVNYRQQGNHGSAFALDWDEEQTAALSRSLGVGVVAETLPLEELFLELTHD